jgi:hypothetical protein
MSLNNLDLYKDYTYIMYIICDKSASFYSKIKNVVNIPIVICSTCLSILNGSEFDQDLEKILMVRYVSIGLNLLIALSIAILNLFKITEKEYAFKSQAMSFLKLYNKIDAETTKAKTLMSEIDVLSIVNEYNLLCEYVTFHIPSHIRKHIEKKYTGYKFPFLLTNTKGKKTKKPAIQESALSSEHAQPHQPEQQPTSPSSSSCDTNITMDFERFAQHTEHTQHTGYKNYQESPFSVLAENLRLSPLFAARRQPMHKNRLSDKFSKSMNNI